MDTATDKPAAAPAKKTRAQRALVYTIEVEVQPDFVDTQGMMESISAFGRPQIMRVTMRASAKP